MLNEMMSFKILVQDMIFFLRGKVRKLLLDAWPHDVFLKEPYNIHNITDSRHFMICCPNLFQKTTNHLATATNNLGYFPVSDLSLNA